MNSSLHASVYAGSRPPGSTLPALTPAAMVPAGLVLVGQLVLAGRYGWHRDELYFIACSRHLAWGYVDQPPLTPAVAWLARTMFGTSLTGLRLFPALANVVVVVLAAVIARELGGGRSSQFLAAAAAAISSVILATGHLLSTTIFDVAAWTAITAIVVHVLRTGRSRWWVAAGVVAGIGLENKYSVAFLLAGIAVGMVATRRSAFRDPWLWLGATVALLIVAPNLAWQASHGWPVITMSHSLRAKGISDGNPYLFIPMQLVFLSPVVTPLWITGLVWLGRSAAGRAYRPLAIAWLVLVVWFVVTAGKPYYLVGLYPLLLAAGAVWLSARWSAIALSRYVGVVAVAGVFAAPLGLPLLPITAVGSGPVAAVNPEFRESYGWPEFADLVRAVPGTIVFAENYGEAGALERFTPSRPVYSGHNSYWLWGPPPDDAQDVVVVGHLSPSFLARNFRGCLRRATIDNPQHIPNQERGAGVWSCSGPVRPWHVEWLGLRHYNA